MTEFQLDTSGAVYVTKAFKLSGDAVVAGPVRFDCLSPFVQGYVTAAFKSITFTNDQTQFDETIPLLIREGTARFSDLARATLAAMLKDCEAFKQAYPYAASTAEQIAEGGYFWQRRQKGEYEGFPPLHLSLADDGLIQQKEVV